MKAVKINLGKVSITVHGVWEDIDYDKLSLVYHKEKNASYISRKPVPKGTMISDRNYWTLIIQGSIPDNTLGEIYTRDEIDAVLATTVSIIKEDLKSTLENYNTKEEDTKSLSDYDLYIKDHINSLLSNYYSKLEIDAKLVDYATKEDLNSYITSEDLNSYATKEDLENAISEEESKLSQYAKKSDLELYATIQLLEGYLKKTDSVNFATKEELALYAKIDSLSSYVTIDSLANYYTKDQIDSTYAKISDIPEIPSFKTINGQSIIGSGNIVIETSSGGGSEGGSTVVENNYNPTLDGETKITTNIGSIKSGTTLNSLAGKSYSEIIDAILVNEVWNDPIYTHTVSLGNVTSLVKVGSAVVIPTVTKIWNNNIKSNYNTTIISNLVKTILGSSETVYNKSGDSTFVLTYSYFEGYYDIVSNLGNTKRIIVPSKTNAVISKTVTATYPWFINNTEQVLVAIGDTKTIEVELTGSPSIKVPFTNSTVTIQADLGFGWMNVDWDVTTDNTNLGSAVDETVPYKVYSKSDSYSNSVKHKITINLNK